MSEQDRSRRTTFDEVPELYDRLRPTYPNELMAELRTVTGAGPSTRIVEIGCGTGQATRSLAALGGRVTALEPGPNLAALAKERLADLDNVEVEVATFEEWEADDRATDLIVAASSWHWVDPAVGWAKAQALLPAGGWLALLGHVVVRRPGEVEAYAETVDLHQSYAPGHAAWRDPPTEAEVRATQAGWGPPNDPADRFGPTTVRWVPAVQWFDGATFADHLRTQSTYRALDPTVREPLLDAIAERIRTRLGDRIPRRYLSVLRAGQAQPQTAHR